MFLDDALLNVVTWVWRGICRAENVKRSAPEEKHTPTEYADAFLFGEEDHGTADASSPPSILDPHRH